MDERVMRVVHLLDQASPQAWPTTLAMMRLRAAAEQASRPIVVGGEPIRWAAEAARLTCEVVSAPYGHALAALPALRRALRRDGGVDAVHAWSLSACAAAGVLVPRLPRTLTLTQGMTERGWATLRRLVAMRRTRPERVEVLSEARRVEASEAGIPGDLLHVVPPDVDASLLRMADRAACRAAWGADDDTHVIALLGDPPPAPDALRADLGLGLVYETVGHALGRRPRVLMIKHPLAYRRLPAQQMMDNYGVGEILAQDARVAAPWLVLPGCDTALFVGDSAGGLGLRWAMAAGVRIVAERGPTVEEWLGDAEDSALLYDRGQPKRLAHRLHQALLAHD